MKYRSYFIALHFLPTGLFFMPLLSSDLFQNQLYLNILVGIPSECQAFWIQIRPDVLSGLIWVLTVCKGYQQMTLVGKELKSVKE